MKKTVLLVFCLFFIIAIIIEFYSFNELKKEYEPFKNKKLIDKNLYKIVPFKYENYTNGMFKKPSFKNSTKKPIILFGCCYMEGCGLKTEETLANRLSELTNRSVYNHGAGGMGAQFIYYQFKNNYIKNEVPDVEYIIYNFIDADPARQQRVYIDLNLIGLNLRYDLENGEFTEKKITFPWLYASYAVKMIEEKKLKKRLREIEAVNTEYKLILKKTIQLAKDTYPDAKFVILVYPNGNCVPDKDGKSIMPTDYNPSMPDNIEQELSDMGVIIIKAEDLLGKKLRTHEYRSSDLDHPNARAWKELAPVLAKKLDL